MAVSRIKTSSILQGFPKSRSLLAGNAGYDPAATWLIQRTTLTSTGSITFSSIPQNYKHLQIRFKAQDALAVADAVVRLLVTFNGAGGTAYAWHTLYGNGSSTFADGTASTSDMRMLCIPTSSLTGLYVGAGIIDIHDYASTTKNKTIRSINGVDTNGSAIGQYMNLTSGVWQSTAAITSITLETTGGYGLASGSTFALYGMVG